MNSDLEDKERGCSGTLQPGEAVPGGAGAERSEGERHMQSEWSVKIPLSSDVSPWCSGQKNCLAPGCLRPGLRKADGDQTEDRRARHLPNSLVPTTKVGDSVGYWALLSGCDAGGRGKWA